MHINSTDDDYYDRPESYVLTILGIIFTLGMIVSAFPLIPRLWRGFKVPSMVIYTYIAMIAHCTVSGLYYLHGAVYQNSFGEAYYWMVALHLFGSVMGFVFVSIAIGRVKAYQTKLIIISFIFSVVMPLFTLFLLSNSDEVSRIMFLYIQAIVQLGFFFVPFAFLNNMRKEKYLGDFYLPIPVTQFLYCSFFLVNTFYETFYSFFSSVCTIYAPFTLLMFYLGMRLRHGPSVFDKNIKMKEALEPEPKLELVQIINGDKVEYARIQRAYDISSFKVIGQLPTFVECHPTTTVGADIPQQKFMEP
ncbi:hypothetical protein CYY_005342 [Polysphondylium violaceum]|uniref:Transmembrane protein n=1 Tax=Polysphondylium violaceum TaxID=133409 RepID=A0A8J4US95_9MYCE|nr:hypothetical protein CYY_005342 [Polysphondylium violaceum]